MLNYEYPPLGGGAGNATRFLINELAQFTDLEIDLVTSSEDAERVVNINPKLAVHYLNIGKHGRNLQHQTYADLLRYTYRASRYLKELRCRHNYQLCHAFFAVPCGYLGLSSAAPLIVSLRGTDVPGHNRKYRPAYALFSPFIKRVFRSATAVVANSADLAAEATAFYRRQYLVIPNGVDLDFFRPGEKTDKRFRILSAGRLHAVKNFDLLIRAFAEFSSHRPSDMPELIIVGDGPEKNRLMSLAKSYRDTCAITFLGHVAADRLREEYRRCSVFCLLSDKEGMSNTLLEAMACGAPILATNTGGAATLVDRTNGKIIDERTVAAVAHALEYFATNSTNYDALARASWMRAQQYSWHSTADKYYSLYNKLNELA